MLGFDPEPATVGIGNGAAKLMVSLPFIDAAQGVAGFSLHASVAVKVNERKKLERICRYISRPAVSEKPLSLTRQGKVRYQLKTPYLRGPIETAPHM